MRLSTKAIIIENDSILLIEYDDETGLHYNFPGGGQEAGESLQQALARELMEEASVEVTIGPLTFVYEYAPHLCSARYGESASILFLFRCTLEEGSRPAMPANPDPNQTAVKWIPLARLDEIVLLPNLGERIKRLKTSRQQLPVYIGEHELQPVEPV